MPVKSAGDFDLGFFRRQTIVQKHQHSQNSLRTGRIRGEAFIHQFRRGLLKHHGRISAEDDTWLGGQIALRMKRGPLTQALDDSMSNSVFDTLFPQAQE